ncbi:MAG: cyclic nucleotide-binding domain-containing protein, partial [Candidatus Bipolaricaulia bacterium]
MIIECRNCEQKERCILSKLEREEPSEVERMLSKSSDRRGELIFQQGPPILGCYIVCQGAGKLVRRTRRGEKQILRILGPGD